jgi:hypothetical protein
MNDEIMGSLESTSQSFIVKVWVEESAEKGGQGVWHGHITHVPSGKRHYMKNLDAIRDFIAPHLEAMGVDLGKRWRMRRWLKRWIGHD